jgi:hypothetical protein
VLSTAEIRPASRQIWQGSRVVLIVLREDNRVRQTFPVTPCERQARCRGRFIQRGRKSLTPAPGSGVFNPRAIRTTFLSPGCSISGRSLDSVRLSSRPKPDPVRAAARIGSGIVGVHNQSSILLVRRRARLRRLVEDSRPRGYGPGAGSAGALASRNE